MTSTAHSFLMAGASGGVRSAARLGRRKRSYDRSEFGSEGRAHLFLQTAANCGRTRGTGLETASGGRADAGDRDSGGNTCPDRSTTPSRTRCPIRCPSLRAGRPENRSSSGIRPGRPKRRRSTGHWTRTSRIRRSRDHRRSCPRCRRLLHPGNARSGTRHREHRHLGETAPWARRQMPASSGALRYPSARLRRCRGGQDVTALRRAC